MRSSDSRSNTMQALRRLNERMDQIQSSLNRPHKCDGWIPSINVFTGQKISILPEIKEPPTPKVEHDQSRETNADSRKMVVTGTDYKKVRLIKDVRRHQCPHCDRTFARNAQLQKSFCIYSGECWVVSSLVRRGFWLMLGGASFRFGGS